MKPEGPLLSLTTEVRGGLGEWLATRSEVRVRNFGLAVFFVAQLVEDLTIAVVVQRPAELDNEEIILELSELVVRYLTGAPSSSGGALHRRRALSGGHDRRVDSVATCGTLTTRLHSRLLIQDLLQLRLVRWKLERTVESVELLHVQHPWLEQAHRL